MGDGHNPQGATGRQRSRPPHVRIRLAGVIVLLAGLTGAVLIYLVAGADTGALQAGDLPLGPNDEYTIERIGGKAALYAVKFNRWLAGLWHGRALAFTVATLAVAISLGCFWLADLASVPLPGDPEDGGKG